MGGGADQLDAALMRLMIGLGTLEARQERVVNVDAAPGQLAGEILGQHLHVTRQHHEFGSGVLDQLPDRRFLLRLCRARHGKIMKRDASEIETIVGFARMVGDDRGRNHRQFAGAPAIENIDKAMIGLRHHQQHALMRRAVAQLPDHVERPGNPAEAGLKRRNICRRARRVEHHPHEEVAGLDVAVLLGVENVLSVGEQEGGDRRHDPRTIRARQGQYELLFGHEVTRSLRERMRTACGVFL